LKSYYPEEGYVEQDGEQIVDSVLQAVKEVVSLFEKSGHSKKEIVCAGISNQRESFLLFDKNGNALTPVIVWQCKRSIEVCGSLQNANLEKQITDITGLRIDPYFSGTKLLYLIENNTDIQAKIKNGDVFFGTIDTWLLYKLTGKHNYKTDFTNASRTLLLDIDSLSYSDDMKKVLKTDNLQLPELCSSAHADFGATNFEGIFDADIPITAMIGDSHSAAFGEGCFEAGTVKATMGTGSSVMMNTGKRVHGEHGMVSTICFSLPLRVDYALEGVIVSCASTVNWVTEKLGIAKTPAALDALASLTSHSGGVTFIPAFSGLGGPYWQMDRKAEILGITFGTSAADIARAALEAYPFQLKDVINSMTNKKLQWLKADGGLTNSKISMQMIADVLQTQVRIDKNKEASALGAALLSFIGNKSLSFTDVENLIANAPFETFTANSIDKNLEKAYHTWGQRIINRG
jgi:glycerol kinase